MNVQWPGGRSDMARPWRRVPWMARLRGRPAGWRLWLATHLGLGLAWIALLASRAGDGTGLGASARQVFWMLLLAGWLPSWALAGWQVQRRRWRALLASDLLAAGALVLLAVTAYLPLFFLNVVWFLPLALLPRGLVTEFLLRGLTRWSEASVHHRSCRPGAVAKLEMQVQAHGLAAAGTCMDKVQQAAASAREAIDALTDKGP